MSVDNQVEFNELATESYRTWRLEIFSDHGSAFRVRIHRERLVIRNSDSKVLSRERLGHITRVVNAPLLGEEETAGGLTANVQQMYALISAFADRWAQEDGEPSAPASSPGA